VLPPTDYKGELDAESLWRALGGEQMQDPPSGKGKGKGEAGNGRPEPGTGCGMEGDGNADDDGEPAPDMDLMRAEVALVSRTTHGGGLLAHVLAPKQNVDEPWKKLLRGVFRSTSSKRGFEQTTYARPKRAGDARLPRYVSTEPKLGIIVDVSGSMSGPFLDKIVDQVFALSHTFPQVKVALISHHTDVAWFGFISGTTDRKAIAKACDFSGGTDAESAYRKMHEMLPNADYLVHFTDCYINNPWPEFSAKRLLVADYGGGNGTPLPKRAKAIQCTIPG
jgi:hypothetical protein